jgi:hypothetical protein
MDRTWKPTTGGILTIIAGSWGIFLGVMGILLSQMINLLGGLDLSKYIEEWAGPWGAGGMDIPEILSQIVEVSSTAFLIGGIIILVFGIIALVGGISAIKRRRWGLSLAGGILSLPLNPVLGVLGIIFIALGRHEFE